MGRVAEGSGGEEGEEKGEEGRGEERWGGRGQDRPQAKAWPPELCSWRRRCL